MAWPEHFLPRGALLFMLILLTLVVLFWLPIYLTLLQRGLV